MQTGKNNCCPYCNANEKAYLTGKCCEESKKANFDAYMDEERLQEKT